MSGNLLSVAIGRVANGQPDVRRLTQHQQTKLAARLGCEKGSDGFKAAIDTAAGVKAAWEIADGRT